MKDDPYLTAYYLFLNEFNMAQKNTFTPEMIIGMENMEDTSETIKLHIENARPHFEEIFQISNFKYQEALTGDKDRIARYIKDVLPNDTPWTEILYCIKISKVKLQTQIFIDKSHAQFNIVKETIKLYGQEAKEVKLEVSDHPKGLLIYTNRKLYDLINNPEADAKIKNWFIESFNAIAEFIEGTPDLQWDLKKEVEGEVVAVK